jgi:hypothetical protein
MGVGRPAAAYIATVYTRLRSKCWLQPRGSTSLASAARPEEAAGATMKSNLTGCPGRDRLLKKFRSAVVAERIGHLHISPGCIKALMPGMVRNPRH